MADLKAKALRDTSTSKWCSHCEQHKYFDQFYWLKNHKKMMSYCISCSDVRSKAAYRKDPTRQRAIAKLRARVIKAEVMTAYGGRCTCCGESDLAFLVIDHVNGGGCQHRRGTVKSGRGGTQFYIYLKREGYPIGFQVLCHNCNWAKFATGGCCPHKAKPSIAGISAGFVSFGS